MLHKYSCVFDCHNYTYWSTSLFLKRGGDDRLVRCKKLNKGDVPKKIINPKIVADRMSSFFNDHVEDLLVYIKGQTSQMKIKYNSNTMCTYRVIENKLNDVVCKLKGKSSPAFDQIPEFLVK